MGAEHWDEQVGSVADEATRLLESLRRSAAEAAAGERTASSDVPTDAGGAPPAATGTAPGARDTDEAGAASPDAGTHDPLCQWCPLCRGAAVVRSLSPETLTRLADLAGLAATVFADLASTRSTGSAGGGPADADRPAPDRSTSSRPIPVRDADDQEAPRG